MPIPITSWLRAFFAVQECAMDARGFVELKNGDDDPIRWPRTTHEDVLAIAATLDPYVRRQPLRFGGHGLARHWRAGIDAIDFASHAEYPENRTFWHVLPAMCVYLHSRTSPMPSPAIWAGLLDLLTQRNLDVDQLAK